MSRRADIVMITYRSAGYIHLSLPRLLDTLGANDRVWLWHNGDDEATIEAIRPFVADDRVAQFHHSRENVRLRGADKLAVAEFAGAVRVQGR